ncbi:GIY-YIG nuclease family protein [Serinicoccus kebangsaanensis]|uniref:GIY-YIG nuclease family protein n=1 Tax=Serinicoccus kebangsaanensis TaxID=2602069 RepID=UPI00124E7E0D|nr:GIY-YIG nuclease family protein [Serinicoccus kebangsaanensis]
MLIGAYGTFWDPDLVDWHGRGWRLLGRQGLQRGTVKVADFRRARGVYALYSDTGIYYVGLASGTQGIGGRLRDHTRDEHAYGWTRFSWFAFDGPSETDKYDDGVLRHRQWISVEADDTVAIREMEALLLAVTRPPGNIQQTKFESANAEWMQVASQVPETRSFDSLRDKLL